MRKVITLLLAAVIVLSAAVFTACSSSDKAETTAPTAAAATQPATQAQQATQAAANDQTSSAASSNTASAGDTASQTSDDVIGVGLTRDEAVEKVKQNAIPGGYITSMYQGYTSDGDAAWIVNITNANGTESVYYVGADFIFTPDDGYEDSYTTDDYQDYTITCENTVTGETFSVICSYADDRYDTVSGYFFLPGGTYNLAVYTYNEAGGNTSLCGTGYYDNSDTPEDGRAPIRVNYYMVTGEVEAEIG